MSHASGALTCCRLLVMRDTCVEEKGEGRSTPGLHALHHAWRGGPVWQRPACIISLLYAPLLHPPAGSSK